jgi:hypothetical protein
MTIGTAGQESFPDYAPVFVVGAPRSGTTLFMRILDAHPELGIADELIYFDIILNARSVVPALDTPERIEQFFTLLPRMDHVAYWSGMEEILAEAKQRLLADPKASYPRLFLYLMQAYADRKGATRFGDKTPWNVRHLDEIVALFPNARIIHLVRDPRANVASRRKLPRTSQDVVTNAVKWKLDILAARRFARGPHGSAQNYLELRYEDLVREPDARVRAVCAFLGIPFDPAMLAFHHSREVMFRDQPYKEGVFRPVHADSLESWRRELRPAQVRLIETICADEMRHFGYERAGEAAGAAATLRQLATEGARWLAFKRSEVGRHKARGIDFYHGSAPLYRLLRSLTRSHLKGEL